MAIPQPSFEKLAIDEIEATAATQVRVKIDKGMVDQYTEDFKNGASFPPLDVFREKNSERTILADGFHRHRAAINAGREMIGCNVHEGGLHEALVFALGTNFDHGFRRSNADKRHAVEMALKDPELSQLLPKEIADVCRVTKRTVERIINEQLSADDDENDSQTATKSQKKKKAEKPKAKDFRDNGAEPTQEDVDLEELRKAVKIINTFPYSGTEALKLPMNPDDVADCELAAVWLGDAVIAYRNKGDEDG